ncbi:MAG: sigma-70 family RNA polymerase sigma factor, partial [Thermoleophilia bacterium]|nr:sigma-70 family RNA polymerase sigma factor [Thermoleophilia bacterium]
VIAQGVLDGEWDIATDASEDDLRRIAQWGQRSLEEMVIGNLKLAIHWAKHYARRDQELAQDLFQEAYKGLVRAIQGWDALRGYKFSTYATWHIRQSIQRAFNGGAERTPVHIPVHVNDQIRKARREGTDLSDLAQVALKWREQTVSWERLEESYADLVSLVEPDPIEGFLERTTIVDAAAQCLAYL